MASVTAFDSLAFVAAALSALTEKQIVTKVEYDRISKEVKSGKNKVYVCAGEVNVVEEIKQTYAKTAQLVAQRYNPDIVRNAPALPIGSNVCEKPEIKKYPSGETKVKKISSDQKKSDNKDKLAGASTKVQSKQTSKGSRRLSFRRLSFRGKFSIFTKKKGNKESPQKQKSTLYDYDYKQIGSKSEIISEISDEDVLQNNEPRRRRVYRKKFNPRNEYRKMDVNSSDEEDFPNVERKRRINTSSPEDLLACSDVETRMKLSSVSWKSIQLQGNLEKNKSTQDIHLMYPDFEKNTEQQSPLFGKSDQNLTDPMYEVLSDKKPLLEEKSIGKARRVSQRKIKLSDSSPSGEDTIPDRFNHSDTEPMITEKLDSLFIASQRTSKTIDLFVVLPLGGTITVEMESTNSLVANIKYKIKEKVGLAVTEQVLHFGGYLLENGKSLNEYKIKANSTIHLSVKVRGGSKERLFFIDRKYLDSSWDYDFTNITDGNNQFKRGGYPYYRPCGWKRIAIKVLGKYENDIWLGQTGDSSKGEWAVTYHGTKSEVFNNIADEGYKIGNREAYGRGVYSAPRIDTATIFAAGFKYDEVNYIGVFQNRVNPNGVNIVNNGEYWVCPDEKNIRPYGLCVKKV